MKDKHLRTSQIVLMAVGLSLLAIFLTAQLHRRLLSRAALERFKEVQEQKLPEKVVRSLADKKFTFDFTLWSPQRIADYERSLAAKLAPPIGILRVMNANLEVPVLDGIDDLTLNRGVGYIPGTAYPGERGNIGIAGHRDGFFRILKDAGVGDVIELETLEQTDTYQVRDIVIVDKNDVSVLRPTSAPTLTLVTCYPFYFIGSAPRRFIVIASLVTSGLPPDTHRTRNSGSGRLDRALQDPKSSVAKTNQGENK